MAHEKLSTAEQSRRQSHSSRPLHLLAAGNELGQNIWQTQKIYRPKLKIYCEYSRCMHHWMSGKIMTDQLRMRPEDLA